MFIPSLCGTPKLFIFSRSMVTFFAWKKFNVHAPPYKRFTSRRVTRVERTWGGLRSFAPDGCPVVGYDKQDDGFFWLIGQGGYGIQSSPALSRLAAALVRREAPSADIMDEGLVLAEISPDRFQ